MPLAKPAGGFKGSPQRLGEHTSVVNSSRRTQMPKRLSPEMEREVRRLAANAGLESRDPHGCN